MFFKIYKNLLEVNPELLNVQDKHEIIENMHDQVLKIVGEDELKKQFEISKSALKEELESKLTFHIKRPKK